MKKALMIATAALTVLGGTAGAASAQSYGYNGNNGYHARYERQEARQDRREYRQDRRADRREVRQQRRWARGQYLPSQYRGRGYVVNDYRRYHLAAPPRGYHYVRQDNDVILTAIATGLIASVFLGALAN